MKILQMAVASFVVMGLAAMALAEDKKIDVKKLIVGKWEVTKADAESLPVGATAEFTADGKLKVVAGDLNANGTYALEGQAFTAKLDINGEEKTHKVAIKSITEKELVIATDDGKEMTFKKEK